MTVTQSNWKQIVCNTKRLIKDRRGSFVPTLGLSTMAVALCAGLAIDYSRFAVTKTVVDNALDAAILATGQRMSEGGMSQTELRNEFEDMFFANVEGRSHYAQTVRIVEFQADEDRGKVTATADALVNTTFMGLAGKESVNIGSDAEARFSSDAIEVAMALDVTGSMRGNKIRDLKDAATNAIDILIPRETNSDKVRIGLIPYAEAVNAGPWARLASGNRSTDCVTERGGPNAFNDASYRGRNGKVGSAVRNCHRYDLIPLTNDRDDLQRAINRFNARGVTAGHIGIAWSYYMLSEKWRSLWPSESKPLRYDDDVHKVAIIMTDGLFNTYYDGVTGRTSQTSETVAKSNAAALELCQDMKRNKGVADGVTVYTIAFALGNSSAERRAKQMLSDCATQKNNDSFYFDAQNGEELKSAFEQIALSIQKLRLSR